MFDDRPNLIAPKAFGAVRSAFLRCAPGCDALTTAHTTARRTHGFTLVELLVSVSVLVLLVLLTTQLINSAATVTTLGHKLIDADSQAREVFDRMAVDFAQMVKRSDVDYYLKKFGIGPFTRQNDQIAFYSTVPGYYPSTGSRSPVSLVGYRVNSDPNSPAYNKMERLGKGLVWNGVSTDTPVVFLPQTIGVTWPSAISTSTPDSDYELIGPQVFRFEYYYLRTDLTLSDQPSAGPGGANGMRNIAAIVVDLAVIDPRSRALLTEDQINKLNFATLTQSTNTFLADFTSDQNQPGQFLFSKWRKTLKNLISGAVTTTPPMPRQALQGIRLYERYFYLSPSAQ